MIFFVGFLSLEKLPLHPVTLVSDYLNQLSLAIDDKWVQIFPGVHKISVISLLSSVSKYDLIKLVLNRKKTVGRSFSFLKK